VDRRGRLAFVPPRYGPEVIGGAEAALSEAAHGLAARGWEVDVLTTCARDHFRWANEYPPGVTRDGDVTVRRFLTVMDTLGVERAAVEAAMLAGQRIGLTEQEAWMNDGLRSPDLFHYVLDRAADYRALVFAPYPFWTTFACAQVAPERTILMPCLHDEPQARLDIFRTVFAGARGLWFLTEPERDVASRLYDLPPTHAVVGSGVAVPDAYDADGFRRRHRIERPFVLYAGRREGAKGWEWMLDAFASAVDRHDLPFALVTSGVGDVRAPTSIADRVVDLGFVDAGELHHAFAAASVYVQPSPYESFSRTLMEAWLAGTLVVGNAASAVVAWHCARSRAGLVFRDAAEFGECLQFAADEPDAAGALASAGRGYVLEHYTWPPVLDVMEATLDEWLPACGEEDRCAS
jgi:glycosyltransferase involved in cell wall biosynthesis